MPSAAEQRAILLAEREKRRAEQEAQDAAMAAELLRLELQEEEEQQEREREARRLREEEARRVREEEERRQQQEATDAELRLATAADREWMVKVLQARNRGELIFHGNDVTAHVTGGDGEAVRDGDCWPCRVREIECERQG